MRKKLMPLLLGLFSLLLGVIYLYTINIEASFPTLSTQKKRVHQFSIYSKVNQKIKLHIKTHHKLQAIVCNGVKGDFKPYTKGYEFKLEEQSTLTLKKGENHCFLENSIASIRPPMIKQKLSFVDYLVLFITIVMPLFHLLFQLLIFVLNSLWRKNNV